MVGSQINQYKILEKIGSGGQGTVYKALDTKLNRAVVIKVLPPELTQKTANYKRFEREAQLCSQLDHPNICTIYDFHSADGVFYIAMQWVEGKNVRQLVSGRPLELKSALSIAIQTADALAEYRGALKFNPKRFVGLYGAARAAEMAGQAPQAAEYYALLVQTCDGGSSERPELKKARETVSTAADPAAGVIT